MGSYSDPIPHYCYRTTLQEGGFLNKLMIYYFIPLED